MNNTKTLTAIAAVLMAATLVVGGTLAATSAFAYSKKKGDEGSKNGNTITALKCQNKGSASGFDTAVNQECENLICTHPGNNATCDTEGVAAVGGGTGGGVAGCTVGANAIVLDTGARVCVSLTTPLVFPVNGGCTPSTLVAVHLDGIDICANIVANL
jgi:hypothetical protein